MPKHDALKLFDFERGEVEFRDLIARSGLSNADLTKLAYNLALRGQEPSDQTAESMKALLAEPHGFGWLHQFLNEDARLESFGDHTRNESKHSSSTVSTQLYTPRWVADFLAQRCFNLTGPGTVLDPACGGGQMLLAWADLLVSAGLTPSDVYTNLRGTDLDPSAVEACRNSLKLHAVRLTGKRIEALEAIIDRNIRCLNGLDGGIDSADVVLMNPPYMGLRSMPVDLKERLKSGFRPFHQDLATAFVLRAHQLATKAVGILTQQTVWYVGRFEEARNQLLELGQIEAFAHLGPHVFRSLTGEKANVVAFVQAKQADGAQEFWDLRDDDVSQKRKNLTKPGVYVDVDALNAIPGLPIAHWLKPRHLTAFKELPTLGDYLLVPGSQNKTGNNAKYVRSVADVDSEQIRNTVGLPSASGQARWAYYSKGGRFCPWWGNWDWVVDWSEEARAFYKSNRTSNLLDDAWIDRPGLCYSDFGGRRFAARWLPKGAIFDMAGPAIFHPEDHEHELLGWMVLINCSTAVELLNALNPSIHYQVRDLRRLPVPEVEDWSELSEIGHQLREAAIVGHVAPSLAKQAEILACSYYGKI